MVNARTYQYHSQPSLSMYTHTGLLMHTHERGSRKDLFILYKFVIYLFSNMYMPTLIEKILNIFFLHLGAPLCLVLGAVVRVHCCYFIPIIHAQR